MLDSPGFATVIWGSGRGGIRRLFTEAPSFYHTSVSVSQKRGSMQKPLIEYPCKWSFRVIGSDEPLMRKAVETTVGDSAYSLMVSNASKTGKYVSLNLETVVRDKGHRNQIYNGLKAAQPIKMVL